MGFSASSASHRRCLNAAMRCRCDAHIVRVRRQRARARTIREAWASLLLDDLQGCHRSRSRLCIVFAGPRTLDVVSFVSGDRRLNVLINPGQPSHRQAVKRCCVEKLQGSRVVFCLSTSTAPSRSLELDSNVVSWPGGRLDAWPARAVDAMLAEAGCYPIKRATLGPWLP